MNVDVKSLFLRRNRENRNSHSYEKNSTPRSTYCFLEKLHPYASFLGVGKLPLLRKKTRLRVGGTPPLYATPPLLGGRGIFFFGRETVTVRGKHAINGQKLGAYNHVVIRAL